MAKPVRTDLVEYFIVVVPDLGSVKTIASAVAALADDAHIRVLDAVALVRTQDDGVEVLELEDSTALEALRPPEPPDALLSDHDVALASLALPTGTAGLVVVVEDRWATSLSAAVRGAGGEIVAGERIPAARVERVLHEMSEGKNA
jgi:hypothetical protein